MMSDDDNDGQMIFGDLGGLKLPDICLTGVAKPRRKNLTQETCPDRVSNQCPLRDRRACYQELTLIELGQGFPCKCMFLYKLVTLLKLFKYSFHDLTIPNSHTFSCMFAYFDIFGSKFMHNAYLEDF